MEQLATDLNVGDFLLKVTQKLVIGKAGDVLKLTESQVRVLIVLADARIEGNQGYHDAEKISGTAGVGEKTVPNCIKALIRLMGPKSVDSKYGYGYRLELPVSRFIATDSSLEKATHSVNEEAHRSEAASEVSQRPIQVPLIFESRHSHWLETLVQGESSTVLFASISSRHTLDRIRPWFDTPGLIKTRHFRVLTWWPSKDALAALSAHVGEKLGRMEENIKSAWDGWRELQEAKDFVEVYRYSSAPTLQAICNDRYIKVEFLPYNREGPGFHECGSTGHRPAIVMDARNKAAAAGYHFFRNAFEDLWVSAMLNAPKKDIHPRWQVRRIGRLSKLGLLPKAH